MDLFGGYTEIDASFDLVECLLPVLESGPLGAFHDELVQTDDVEQRDVFLARPLVGLERAFRTVQPRVGFVPPPAQRKRERAFEHPRDVPRDVIGSGRLRATRQRQ